jgi:O-antigen ligase
MNKQLRALQARSTRGFLLTAQLILLYLPNWQLVAISTDNGQIPGSAAYFFSLVFVPYLVVQLRQQHRLRVPPWYYTAFVGYLLLLAAVRFSRYGVGKNILHWVFGFYLLVVVLNVGRDLTRQDWLRILETGACVFAVLHFLCMVQDRQTVIWLVQGFFSGSLDGRAATYLASLTRGGRNLDATWLGLGLFFVRGKKKAVYGTYAILFAFLGCSRVGVLAVGLACLWSLVWDPLYRLTLKKLKWYALYAAVILAVLFAGGMAQAFLGRSLIVIEAPGVWLEEHVATAQAEPETETDTDETASEESSIRDKLLDTYGDTAAAVLSGRAAIWRTVPQMVRDNPFGYGAGNAMRVMRTEYGFTGGEDIVHNVFLQLLVDEGILGGVWYLALVAAFLWAQWKRRPRCFADPLGGYLLAYVLLSLVQFHGGEALMLFTLGVFWAQEGAALRPDAKQA